jgi:hypothetical protein
LEQHEQRSRRKRRFSEGLERRPATHAKQHQGSFAEGLETRPHGLESQPRRRFSEGLETNSNDPSTLRNA